MNAFFAGWVLLLQAAFWGLGLTLLILPARWRRFWPAWAGPTGLTLQSCVVWAGAHTPLAGTDSYALTSLLLPAGLLVAAFRLHSARETRARLAAAGRWWVLAPILALSLALQIAPFTKPPGTLTTASLGSCDGADYAAGARTLKEFSSLDRSGFLGQPEQLPNLSVSNFYDFWLRLNHFTPSALIALDASLLHHEPYELASLLGMVFVLLQLPTVFWLARSLFRFRPAAAAVVTLVYGCSPVVLYAVGQVALGQLLAAPAVALILWSGRQADRATRCGDGPGRLWAYSGLLLVGNSLLMSSYNFFIIFAYVPLAAFVGARVLLQRRGWRPAARLAAFLAANLAVCALLFPERFIGLAERFVLFRANAFGWNISALRPDGWYGSVGDAYLHPGTASSMVLGVFCLLALAAASWELVRRGHGRTAGWAAACVLPILCGYGILNWEESARVRINASYDAYKLFTVFYPVILPGLCLWLAVGWERTASLAIKLAAGSLAAVLLLANLAGAERYNVALRTSSLIIGPGLPGLATLERVPGVPSVNISLPTVWDEMWANQFLLHKPQYLQHRSYEGRGLLPPLARWDLSLRSFAPASPPSARDPLAADPEFTAVDRQAADFMEFHFASGWYAAEQLRGSHWYWAGPAAVITLSNPHAEPMEVTLHLTFRVIRAERVRLTRETTILWEGRPGEGSQTSPPVPLRLPPGETVLRFVSDGLPAPLPNDPRALAFALSGFQMQAEPRPAAPSQP